MQRARRPAANRGVGWARHHVNGTDPIVSGVAE